MKILSASIRNKLMVACGLVTAVMLASPAALAHDGYYHHGDRAGDLLGALVVGAVIGGVVASTHRDRYYYDGGYYAPQPYPSGYYGYNNGYAYPAYQSYPAYGYGGYYGSGVNVGVYYRGGYDHWRGHDRGYYRDSRGYYGGSQGWRDRNGRDHGNGGHGHGHYYGH